MYGLLHLEAIDFQIRFPMEFAFGLLTDEIESERIVTTDQKDSLVQVAHLKLRVTGELAGEELVCLAAMALHTFCGRGRARRSIVGREGWWWGGRGVRRGGGDAGEGA